MKIYNTLTKYHEEIVGIEKNKIKMYSCGPTVYRYIHIGNLRTFTMADWIRRVFEYRGLEVLHVKNITDVGHMRREVVDQGEDKVEAQARKEGKTSLSIAQFYMDAFLADEAKLNILPAHIFPRASQHVPEMISIIQGLEQKGVAYAVNGNVYFDIKRFPGYGKLSGNLLENMMAGIHEGVDTDRHNGEDFPLWKVAEPGREMAWDSPWGRGFPGWHIECSAMAMKYLGAYFDIHTGGVDNIFPHHEDEIAQVKRSQITNMSTIGSMRNTSSLTVKKWLRRPVMITRLQRSRRVALNQWPCATFLRWRFIAVASTLLFAPCKRRKPPWSACATLPINACSMQINNISFLMVPCQIRHING